MTNYYHLSKKELSYFSFIQEPLFSTYDGSRLSRPVVISFSDGRICNVWSLSWFRYKLRNYPNDLVGLCFEIHSMY